MKNILGLLFLFFVTSAHAQNYIGIGIGRGVIDIDSAPELTTDEESRVIKVITGHQLNPHFAVEAGYTDFGEYSAKLNNAGIYGRERLTGDTLSIVGIGFLPLSDKASLFGKFGFSRWAVEDNFFITDGVTTLSGKESETGMTPLLGLGLEFKATKTLALRVELERYADIGDPDTIGESDIDAIIVAMFRLF